MMRLFFILVGVLCLLGLSISAQTPLSTHSTNAWSIPVENEIVLKGKRLIIPEKYKLLQLDIQALEAVLETVPKRFSSKSSSSKVLLEFPFPDQTENQVYEIMEVGTMSEVLSDKFPKIRTYLGINIHKPSERIRFDWTTHGLHAMSRFTEEGTLFIDPYGTKDLEYYICYYAKDYKRETGFHCSAEDHLHKVTLEDNPKNDNTPSKSLVGSGQLFSYRLAVAATTEYTSYHGGSVADAMSEIVTAINRVNELLEVDLSVTLELIDDNDEIIYTPPFSDPYSNNNLSAMLNQNENNLNSVIGEDNYDIGHVFSTANGGLAWVLAVCTYAKARAATGLYNPINDFFYLEYVAHEIGHQLGANHSFNSSCDGNSVEGSGVEVGSGTTTMSYAGTCDPEVQDYKDSYFHGGSMNDIGSNLLTGWGVTCAVAIGTTNTKPLANAGQDYTIPVGTPFVLTGTATDLDGDDLSYCWEQMDATVSTQPPSAYSYNGPNFRSYPPNDQMSWSFPTLGVWTSNADSDWEVLTNVQREMNFQFTVRDNNAQGGLTAMDQMTISTTTSAGPFYLTTGNAIETWYQNENKTIEWNVANTDDAPIYCSHVKILLSEDGGFTFPHVLAENTPNDGAHTVSVPVVNTTTARIRIEAVDHIFFDINDVNLNIYNPGSTFSLQAPTELYSCQGGNTSCNILLDSYSGFGSNVDLSASGGPANSIFDFSSNNFIPNSSSSVLTIELPAGVSPGVYPIYLTANGGNVTQQQYIELEVVNPTLNTVAISPVTGTTDLSLYPSFSWYAVNYTEHYLLQISKNANFSTLNYEASCYFSMHIVQNDLEQYTNYYWRVKAVNECGDGVYSSVRTFETGGAEYCTTAGDQSSYDWIQAFEMGDFYNYSGNNNGYEDFTNLNVDLTAGDTYETIISHGNSPEVYPEYVKIWIDYNADGVFDDNNELLFDAGEPNYGETEEFILIPSTAPTVETTMRVSLKWNSGAEPCEIFGYGEVEDYKVSITNSNECAADIDNDSVCDDEDVCLGGDDNLDVNGNNIPDDCEPVSVLLKVFLEGCYQASTGQMHTQLNDNGLIPLNHPYTIAPYFLPAFSVASIPNNVVDWVMVQVRTGPQPVDEVESKVAFLLESGDIVETDGISPLSFDLPPGGSYYFVVRHRNHLDAMTKVSLDRNLQIQYDFTTDPLQSFGNYTQKLSIDGKAMLYAGDMDQNLVIQVTDYDLWFVNPATIGAYDDIDVNLDGTIQVTDYDVWFENASKILPVELGY